MALRLAGLLLACALAFAACGEGGGREEAVIEEMIVTTAMSDDPAGCTEFLTLHYLEQTTKLDGEAAVESCEEEAMDPGVENPSEVVVSQVEVDGDSATATVSLTGSSFDGQTVRWELVERDGRWKIHELLGFVDLDAEKLVTEMGRELLRKASSPQEAESMSCIVGLLGEMSAPALERLMLDDSLEPMLALGERCIGGSSSL